MVFAFSYLIVNTDKCKRLKQSPPRRSLKHICEVKFPPQSLTCAGNVLSEEEVMTIINAADKDGDGHLDFEEFVKIMMAR